MISNLFKSLRLAITFCLFFGVFYILVLWLFAQVAGPNKGDAELVILNGKIVGAANVGQNFTQDIYFWRCPPHAGDDYDASSSTDSNKKPSNEEYLALLKEHIDTFLVHRPYLIREKVPVEIITASGPGLNPHISPKATYAQTKRVANAHGWSEEKVMSIVNSHVEKPLLGMLGMRKANVLKLSVAFDQASNNK